MSEQRVALEILRDLHSKGDYNFSFDLVEKILSIESLEQYSNEVDKRIQKIENVLRMYLQDKREGSGE